MASDVARLQAVRERAALEDGDREVVACPFKGLASYESTDAELFFGRERLVAEIVARLAGAPLIGIVGAVGQRQVVGAAGRAARRARGRRAARQRGWPLALLRPGEHPLRALERATAEATAGSRLVVAVDQFEELFTVCGDEGERAAFVDALVARRAIPRGARSCWWPSAPTSTAAAPPIPGLSRLLGADHVLVGPMRRDELRRAIELPARRAGLTVEPDAGRRADRRRRGRTGRRCRCSHRAGRALAAARRPPLRMSAYERRRRARGGRAAGRERIRAAEPAQREIARRSCCGSRARARANRRYAGASTLAELDAGRDERVAEVLAALADDRLVTIARARSRSRTRRCCASGRACAAGSRRTPKAAACIGTCAPPPANGTRAAATPASSTAAPGWRGRWSGRPPTSPSSTRPSASSSTTVVRRRSAPSAACAPCSRASRRCSYWR